MSSDMFLIQFVMKTDSMRKNNVIQVTAGVLTVMEILLLDQGRKEKSIVVCQLYKNTEVEKKAKCETTKKNI
jgi:hypothetical protein